jgi:hypothetical protein
MAADYYPRHKGIIANKMRISHKNFSDCENKFCSPQLCPVLETAKIITCLVFYVLVSYQNGRPCSHVCLSHVNITSVNRAMVKGFGIKLTTTVVIPLVCFKIPSY